MDRKRDRHEYAAAAPAHTHTHTHGRESSHRGRDAADGTRKRRRDSWASSDEVRGRTQRRGSRGHAHAHTHGHAHAHTHASRRHGHSSASSPSRHASHDSHSSGSSSHDDTVGHLDIAQGDVLGDRYTVLTVAGTGTFGKVVLCEDTSSSSRVAVKVVRRVPKYTDAARIEADVLADIMAADPAGLSGCVKFYRAFEHRGHFCLVFEPLGPSLFDYVRANEYHPPPLHCVQAFADALLTSVAFLHEMKLVHTDLKLENILLVSREPFRRTNKLTSTREPRQVLAPRYTDVKLIDFGGATYDWEHKSSIINTRQYRAPEVILGLGWSMPSDVWSLGCILMELYTGSLLFQTHDNAEHLALMEAILGPLPPSLTLVRNSETTQYFDRHGRQRYPTNAVSRESVRFVRAQRRLEDLVHPRDIVFADLIRAMLTYDPAQRITAKEAVNHRFFTAVRSHKVIPTPAVIPRPPNPVASRDRAPSDASVVVSSPVITGHDAAHVVYAPTHTEHRSAKSTAAPVRELTRRSDRSASDADRRRKGHTHDLDNHRRATSRTRRSHASRHSRSPHRSRPAERSRSRHRDAARHPREAANSSEGSGRERGSLSPAPPVSDVESRRAIMMPRSRSRDDEIGTGPDRSAAQRGWRNARGAPTADRAASSGGPRDWTRQPEAALSSTKRARDRRSASSSSEGMTYRGEAASARPRYAVVPSTYRLPTAVSSNDDSSDRAERDARQRPSSGKRRAPLGEKAAESEGASSGTAAGRVTGHGTAHEPVTLTSTEDDAVISESLRRHRISSVGDARDAVEGRHGGDRLAWRKREEPSMRFGELRLQDDEEAARPATDMPRPVGAAVKIRRVAEQVQDGRPVVLERADSFSSAGSSGTEGGFLLRGSSGLPAALAGSLMRTASNSSAHTHKSAQPRQDIIAEPLAPRSSHRGGSPGGASATPPSQAARDTPRSALTSLQSPNAPRLVPRSSTSTASPTRTSALLRLSSPSTDGHHRHSPSRSAHTSV